MGQVVLKMIAAFSGGKDSTAMVLHMRPAYVLFTPTGNELPLVRKHIEAVAVEVGAELICPKAPTLGELIDHFNAVPNPRMRWCTRMIKIEPAIAWLANSPEFCMAVGLRADEPERGGLYGLPPHRYCAPMQDWDWGIDAVASCLSHYDFAPPVRTDCAVCPYQRLGEWWRLWKNHPVEWAQGECWEQQTGHTFRSPSRDTWPAALRGLRERFEAGDVPRGAEDDGNVGKRCRVCTL
jgi:hypothetical protein